MSTLNAIAVKVLNSGANYIGLFGANPAVQLTARERAAVARVQTIIQALANWTLQDTPLMRSTDMTQLLAQEIGPAAATDWQAFVGGVPPGATLEEVNKMLRAPTQELHDEIIASVYDRLQIAPPAPPNTDRVRIMTMHGAKGLSGKVVFIPGLEEDIFPGTKKLPFPGLISECARMLYVSITRARSACILSYANRRMVNGRTRRSIPSRFCLHTNGAFQPHNPSLPAADINEIWQVCQLV